MPAIIIPLTLLGLVPFIACGLAVVGRNQQTAALATIWLIDYAALILAFSGGVHWGLALLPGSVRPTARIAAGVVPMLVGLAALLLIRVPTIALGVLILGYLATVLTEHRAAQQFLVPSRYVWTRWAFTTVAVIMMALVMILQLFPY